MDKFIHKFEYEPTRYAGSAFTYKVTWKCSCGKAGVTYDSDNGASPLSKAKTAHARHVSHELAKSTLEKAGK